MKKENLLIVVVILFSCFMFPNNASAMCAIQARIGDIRNEIDDAVCFLGTGETSKNNDGTAYSNGDGKHLILDHYNGKSINFYDGLGGEAFVEIELIGDNYITNEDGYGIFSQSGAIIFTGTGSLTIKSKIPFVSYEDLSNESPLETLERYLDDHKDQETTTIKIIAGETKNDITTGETENKNLDNNSSNEDDSLNDNSVNIYFPISIIMGLLSITLIIVLLFKNNKNK